MGALTLATLFFPPARFAALGGLTQAAGMAGAIFGQAPLGWWVLAAGLARYLLWLAARPLPWLRGDSPPRRWAKVVAALQGVVLTVAMAGVLPRALTAALLATALALLAESFGRQVVWLWRHRVDAPVAEVPAPEQVAA